MTQRRICENRYVFFVWLFDSSASSTGRKSVRLAESEGEVSQMKGSGVWIYVDD